MSYFTAPNGVKSIPYEYRGVADYIFEEQAITYGKYPTKKFKAVKQPALQTPDRELGAEGDATYTKKLKARVVPGSVVVTGPTVDAEDPTNVVLTDDGKDFVVIGDADHYFITKSAVAGPLGYKLTVEPKAVVRDPDTNELEGNALAASFSNNHLVVQLGLEDSAPATTEIGASNKIDVSFLKHGEHGNDWEFIIESDNTVVRPINAVYDEEEKTITLELATGLVADDPASLAVESGGSGTTSVVTVEATAAGAYDGVLGNGIEVAFVDNGSAGLSASYDTGTTTIIVNLGGDVSATPTAVAGVINGIVGFDAIVTTDEENFTFADDQGSKGFLIGGTNLLDATANTRTGAKTQVELLVDGDSNDLFSVDVGAHGAIAFTEADEDTYVFADGYDGGDLDDTKNTLATVRAVIHALTQFACEAVSGTTTTVVDADDLVSEKLFSTYLVDGGGVERGNVDRETGLMSVNFGADTVLPPYATSKYYKYSYAGIDHPTDIAMANREYTVVYVDLRGEGKIWFAEPEFVG